MEIPFTPEQESRLTQLAAFAGTEPADLVRDAALQRLEEDEQFHAAVLEGKAHADRGEFIEEDEVDTRFEQMLRS